MIVDFHHHFVPRELIANDPGDKLILSYDETGAPSYTTHKLLFDHDAHIAMMDESGIDVAMLSSASGMSADIERSRLVNNTAKALEKAYPKRYLGFAHANPLGGPEAMKELARCADELGYPGVTITSEQDGLYLDAPQFEPFWAECEKRGLFVFVHPALKLNESKQFNAYDLARSVGREFSLVLATIRLINGQVFDRHPGLIVQMSHLGGGIAALLGRLRSYQDKEFWGTKGNATHGIAPAKDFDHYLRHNFIFDTGGFCGEIGSVKTALVEIPASRLVFGTDYPQEIRTSAVTGTFIKELRKLGADGEAILSGTAKSLLQGRVRKQARHPHFSRFEGPAMTAPASADTTAPRLPLAGVRVVEFTHMIMGPSCGMVLADLGADVVKVEPLTGDNTRRLLGAGAGFFAAFNRNKRSLALDLKSPRGREIALKLAARADVFVENFKTGALDRLGLGWNALEKLNPRLVYVSHKGFLPGPYDHRTALDEVVQMMGGLAYMTGPEGRPLRAGSSVNDIMGGMFGAIGALAALAERDHPVHGTGRGRLIESALFENNILLVAQHMMQFAVTGKAANPMPNRISPWAIYEVFSVKDDGQIFLAVVSDTQWEIFCKAFGFDDLRADERLSVNNKRVVAREWLMPELKKRLATFSAKEIAARFEAHGLPYAPIARPHELFEDPHLVATGGLAPITIPADGTQLGRIVETSVPLLPLALDGARLAVRLDPPALGEHAGDVLAEIGLTPDDINRLRADGVVGPASHVEPS